MSELGPKERTEIGQFSQHIGMARVGGFVFAPATERFAAQFGLDGGHKLGFGEQVLAILFDDQHDSGAFLCRGCTFFHLCLERIVPLGLFQVPSTHGQVAPNINVAILHDNARDYDAFGVFFVFGTTNAHNGGERLSAYRR